MAEVYRNETEFYGREREYGYNAHMRDEGLRNDDALLVRDSNTMSRYPLHYLFTESRVNSRPVGEDSLGSVFASRGENHDGFVRRALPSVNLSRSPDTYDDDGDDFEYCGQGRNVSRIPIEDARDGLRFSHEDGSRGLSPRLRSSGHHGLVQGVADEGRYSARESEVLPHFEGELSRTYGDRNGLSYSPEGVSRSLAPLSRSVGQRTTYYEHSGAMIGPENGARSLTPHRQRTPSEEITDYTAMEREYLPHRERGIVRHPYDDQSGIRLGHEGGPRGLTPRARSSGQCTPIEGIANERNYPSRIERELSRRLYDDENGLRFSREGRSHSSTPRSHSSGQRTPFQDEVLPQEVLYRSADVIGSGTRISFSRLSSHTPYSMTDGVSHRLYAEALSPNAEYAPSVYRSDDYIDPESRRSRNVSREVEYGDGYEDGHGVQDCYTQEAANGIDYVNGYVEHSHRDVIEGGHSGLHNISHPHEAFTSDNAGVPVVDYEMGLAEVNIGPRNSYPEDIYGSLPLEEHYLSERIAYANSPRRNEEALLRGGNTRLIVDPGDLPEQSDAPVKRMHETVDRTCDAKQRNISVRDRLTYDDSHHIVGNEGEVGGSSRSIRFHHELHSRVGTSNTDIPLTNPRESDKGGVMSRVSYHESVEPYDKAKGTESRRKLKRVPKQDVPSSTARDPDGLESELSVNKKQKLATEDSGRKHNALGSKVVDPDFPVFRVKPPEELPEDSEKFKRHVDEWFMKCMAYLNGNTGCQKRFRADGARGPLKCIICSSHVDFAQTKDVATHAFSSPKVGYRALHLGFHQALCVLMGWNSAVASNGRWVCQPLPELMDWSLREEIIIWPPVVIIHKNPANVDQVDELPNVSEELQTILRDNGFGSYIKACHEKPGNPNMMVVEFVGIVPGFKEAERLHNFFADNKHGRIEIARIDSDVVCCKSLLTDTKPEDEVKVVGKRESDQNAVDKTTVEQLECKTGDNLIKKDNGGESLDNTQFDQHPSDTRLDELKSIVMVHNDVMPIMKAMDDQLPEVTAQDIQIVIVNDTNNQKSKEDAQELIVTVQHPNGTAIVDQDLVAVQDDQDHKITAQEDQGPKGTVQNDQDPLVTVQDDHESIVGVLSGQGPEVMAQDDEEPKGRTQEDDQGLKVTAQDGQEPILLVHKDQEIIVTAQIDKERGVTAQDEQAPIVTAQKDGKSVAMAQIDHEMVVSAQDDKESVVMAQIDQERVIMVQDDQEPIVTAQKDLESVVTVQVDQQSLVKTQGDQEPIITAQDEQEPIDKNKDDSLLVNTSENDQERAIKKEYKPLVLYGYLGIIDELNILPSNIIRRHLARSKKEIIASYNAVM